MICTLTVNPALDRLLFISELNRDNTNRIKRTETVLGGKGTHVSVNLRILGCENRAYGIGYGDTGRRIEKMLEECGVQVAFLHKEEGESRTNFALIEDSNICTLITEKGKTVPKKICEELIGNITETLKNGDYLILSGDASNTEIPYIYNVLIDRIREVGLDIRIFLDTSSQNLVRGLEQKPFLVKPNEDELSQIMGCPVETDEDVLKGIEELSQKGISCVAVSRGAKGSIVKYGGDIYKVHPLKVNVVNTIGCGDAFLSGLAYGFEKEMGFEDILRTAAAVSAATAESDMTVGFDRTRAQELKKQVQLEKLNGQEIKRKDMFSL